ncbi:hypothetical protein ACFX16_000445 [Malus domestica]
MQQWKLRDELVEQVETDVEQGSQGGELRGPGAVRVQMIPLNSLHLHAHFPHVQLLSFTLTPLASHHHPALHILPLLLPHQYRREPQLYLPCQLVTLHCHCRPARQIYRPFPGRVDHDPAQAQVVLQVLQRLLVFPDMLDWCRDGFFLVK